MHFLIILQFWHVSYPLQLRIIFPKSSPAELLDLVPVVAHPFLHLWVVRCNIVHLLPVTQSCHHLNHSNCTFLLTSIHLHLHHVPSSVLMIHISSCPNWHSFITVAHESAPTLLHTFSPICIPVLTHPLMYIIPQQLGLLVIITHLLQCWTPRAESFVSYSNIIYTFPITISRLSSSPGHMEHPVLCQPSPILSEIPRSVFN